MRLRMPRATGQHTRTHTSVRPGNGPTGQPARKRLRTFESATLAGIAGATAAGRTAKPGCASPPPPQGRARERTRRRADDDEGSADDRPAPAPEPAWSVWSAVLTPTY